MLTLLTWRTDLLWILCLFAVPERWPWAAVRDKIFTHSFLKTYSVGCGKARAHSVLGRKKKSRKKNKKVLYAFSSSGTKELRWETRETAKPQLSSNASTRPFLSTTILTTTGGFHSLHNRLLNLHQLPNKSPHYLSCISFQAARPVSFWLHLSLKKISRMPASLPEVGEHSGG